MGYAEEKNKIFLSDLVVNKKSQGNIFTEKPVFTENGEFIIISSGRICNLYNTATGNHVKELFQCADEIVSCQLHPVNSSQVIAITENGEVISFNLNTGEVEHSTNLTLIARTLNKQNIPKFTIENEENEGSNKFDWTEQPVDSVKHRRFIYAEVKPYKNNPSEILVWASWCLNDEDQCHVSVFSFENGKQNRQISFRKLGLSKRYMNFVVSNLPGMDVFVGYSKNLLYVAYFNEKDSYQYLSKRHFIGYNVSVSCIAFHPVECSFATGDSLGRIIVWRNIFDKHPLKDMFHWHTLPVRELVFSKFGNYIFSGGEENVLVKWSLTSRNKDFLPRLSSTIHHISVASESSLVSISTTDSRVLIINFNFNKISTIQNFSRWSHLKENTNRDVFTIDPRSESLVLNGKTGHIQFLSIKGDGKFMYTFDVTNRNFITSDSNTSIENTEVTHAKFNSTGKWLITVERREDGQYRDTRMKFWSYEEKESTFSLNTNVELVHEDYPVYSLEVSEDDKVATTGADKKFRLWSLFEYQQVNTVKNIWSILSVNKYRNLSCKPLDFSKDSSLIAVGFGPVLTIWETTSSTLKCSLSVPFRKNDLKACKFGNNECSHLVVTGTDYDVSTWNTITLSMMWTVPVKLALLVSDPFSLYMSAFSVDNSLIVFNPGSPTPDLLLKNVTISPVVAAQCSPNDTGKFCLYFITLNQELYCLEDSEKPSAEICDGDTSMLTSYAAQMAKIQNRPVSGKKEAVQSNRNKQLMVTSLMESPAHTLPNPSLLCLEVLKGLLIYCNQSGDGSTDKKPKSEDIHEVKERTDSNLVNKEAKLMNIVSKIFV